jgi:hypothetical protein
MPLVSVDFLSVATVKRTIVVDVPTVGTPASQLAEARQKAGIEMAKDEDRNNVAGGWSVLRVVDPPFIDSAPRFTASSLDPASVAAITNRPKSLFG